MWNMVHTVSDPHRGATAPAGAEESRTERMSFPSDLEIASGAILKPLDDIASRAGIPLECLEPYGVGVAKTRRESISKLRLWGKCDQALSEIPPTESLRPPFRIARTQSDYRRALRSLPQRASRPSLPPRYPSRGLPGVDAQGLDRLDKVLRHGKLPGIAYPLDVPRRADSIKEIA